MALPIELSRNIITVTRADPVGIPFGGNSPLFVLKTQARFNGLLTK